MSMSTLARFNTVMAVERNEWYVCIVVWVMPILMMVAAPRLPDRIALLVVDVLPDAWENFLRQAQGPHVVQIFQKAQLNQGGMDRDNTLGWQHHEFFGNRWQRIHKPERQRYLKNAYRVLLTRARQGMVIVVPEGTSDDATSSTTAHSATCRTLGCLACKRCRHATRPLQFGEPVGCG
jgi:hypothetical protein